MLKKREFGISEAEDAGPYLEFNYQLIDNLLFVLYNKVKKEFWYDNLKQRYDG